MAEPGGGKISRADLERELGGKLPGLDGLSDAELRRLHEQLQKAIEGQERALRHAFKETLSHLPAVLRGPVRKLFEDG